MDALSAAKEILETMLGRLGFVVEVEATDEAGEPCLQVVTEEVEVLTGADGERLDDLQYLVNRILRLRDEGAPRVRVDVGHYRAMREDRLVEEARKLAEGVKRTGEPATMRPLNSYFRRVVHNAFLDDEEVVTWSPPGDAQLKRIMLKRRETP